MNKFDLIKYFEKLTLTSYTCQAGIWTIGYGHTGGDVQPNMTITLEYAEKLLKDDINNVELQLTSTLDKSLPNNVHDALVSFIFNIGINAFKHSTMLLKLQNNEDIRDEFLKWIHVHEKISRGLVFRRVIERMVYLDTLKQERLPN